MDSLGWDDHMPEPLAQVVQWRCPKCAAKIDATRQKSRGLYWVQTIRDHRFEMIREDGTTVEFEQVGDTFYFENPQLEGRWMVVNISERQVQIQNSFILTFLVGLVIGLVVGKFFL